MIDDVSNLFVGTISENIKDAYDKGRRNLHQLDEDEVWEDVIQMGVAGAAHWHNVSQCVINRYVGFRKPRTLRKATNPEQTS